MLTREYNSRVPNFLADIINIQRVLLKCKSCSLPPPASSAIEGTKGQRDAFQSASSFGRGIVSRRFQINALANRGLPWGETASNFNYRNDPAVIMHHRGYG